MDTNHSGYRGGTDVTKSSSLLDVINSKRERERRRERERERGEMNRWMDRWVDG